MTDPPSLEDTIAEAAHNWMYGDNGTQYTRVEMSALADDIAAALRAAGAVPAEPATYEPLAWLSEAELRNLRRARHEQRHSHYVVAVRTDRRDDYFTVPLVAGVSAEPPTSGEVPAT